MKILGWIKNNIFFVLTLFFLAFIPLYPKFPLIDIRHTWVYIRLEDFLILLTAIFFAYRVFKKKESFKTPLTFPIFLFWALGGVSTLFAIIFIFPTLMDAFPALAILHYLRRIEYILLFFIAYSGIKDKKYLYIFSYVAAIVLLVVVGYGIGQRLFPGTFHAFLTMNEEFAKGVPLMLSKSARIPSTFAGHYDLAAYLVLLIPFIGSLVFAFKNRLAKLFFLFAAFSGLVLLLMTSSRVSFTVYLFAIAFMLFFQKKKIYIIPVIAASILLLNSFQGISERFGSTISQADVVVDARTGKPIGIAKQLPKKAAKIALTGEDQEGETQEADETEKLSNQVVIEDIQSTGENLPQGTGFINLSSEPTFTTITQVFYKRSKLKEGSPSAEITSVEGDFIIKKALAYDVSFTTRFQGEWPRAIEAFRKNIFLGSGYSSISLATDNNYLRILGETGITGFLAFVLIFVFWAIYIQKVLPFVQDNFARSFVIGVSSGVLGLGFNAILIDVFEASKVAYSMWILIGVSVAVLRFYQKNPVNFAQEIKKMLLGVPAIAIYLLLVSFGLFYILANNYFTGDDFTWLRWAADCKKVLYKSGKIMCQPLKDTILGYFTNAEGFFYRPGSKLYFLAMYAIFWLNSGPYHIFSVLLHLASTFFMFLLSARILKNKWFGLLVAVFFLVSSGHFEAIYWISSVGHLFASFFILLGFLFFVFWKENKNYIYLILSLAGIFVAFLFHELGIVGPLFVIAYDVFIFSANIKEYTRRIWLYFLYLLPIPFYLYVRAIANSHWLSGDYNYNLSRLAFNIAGNSLGYFSLAAIGGKSLYFFQELRSFMKLNLFYGFLGILLLLLLFVLFYFYAYRKLNAFDKRVFLLSIALFLLPLAPFIGLGNISSRYAYLSSFGTLLLLVFFIKKVYFGITVVRKSLALAFVFLVVFLFSLFHILDLRRIDRDWDQAGFIAKKLLVTFNETFLKTKAVVQNPVYYFVNVPIAYGSAWVFPVGLPDALWFVYQNEYLSVNLAKSLDQALDAAEGSASAKVFEFDRHGNTNEVIRTKQTITVPLK